MVRPTPFDDPEEIPGRLDLPDGSYIRALTPIRPRRSSPTPTSRAGQPVPVRRRLYDPYEAVARAYATRERHARGQFTPEELERRRRTEALGAVFDEGYRRWRRRRRIRVAVLLTILTVLVVELAVLLT